jgi:hypothetical protein
MRLMSYEGPAFPVLRRLSQEDGEFKASLGYIVRHCLLKKKHRLARLAVGWYLGNISIFPKCSMGLGCLYKQLV